MAPGAPIAGETAGRILEAVVANKLTGKIGHPQHAEDVRHEGL